MQSGSNTGIIAEHNGEKTSYPAVEIEDNFAVYSTQNYSQPLVCIDTKNGDTVWMTVADHNKPLRDFELLQWIHSIKQDRVPHARRYNSVTFPMVDLDQEVDITWLLNMALAEDAVIAQALQQTKLKMNEIGARVKSAVAIGLCEASCMPRKEAKIVIDKPFYLWIERPGVTDPIFAGYISQNEWKDPKNLEL